MGIPPPLPGIPLDLSHPETAQAARLIPAPTPTAAPPPPPLPPPGSDIDMTDPGTAAVVQAHWQHFANQEIQQTPGLSQAGRMALMQRWGGMAQPINFQTYRPGQANEPQPLSALRKGISDYALPLYGAINPQGAMELQGGMESAYPTDDTLVNNLARGAGSGLAAVPALMAGGPVASSIIGGVSGVGQGRTEVAERRAAGEQISGLQAFWLPAGYAAANAVTDYVGGKLTTEAVPMAVNKIGGGLLTRAATAVGGNILGGALTQGLNQVGNNAVANAVLDQNSPGIFEGTGRAVVQGIGSGLVHAPLSIHAAKQAQHQGVVNKTTGAKGSQVAGEPSDAQARAAVRYIAGAAGKSPVYFQTPSKFDMESYTKARGQNVSPRDAARAAMAPAGGGVYAFPSGNHIYVNTAAPREALASIVTHEVLGHVAQEPAIVAELDRLRDQHADAVQRAGDGYLADLEAAGYKDRADGIRQNPELFKEESTARFIEEALSGDPTVTEDIAGRYPGFFARMGRGISELVDKASGGNKRKGRFIQEQLGLLSDVAARAPEAAERLRRAAANPPAAEARPSQEILQPVPEEQVTPRVTTEERPPPEQRQAEAQPELPPDFVAEAPAPPQPAEPPAQPAEAPEVQQQEQQVVAPPARQKRAKAPFTKAAIEQRLIDYHEERGGGFTAADEATLAEAAANGGAYAFTFHNKLPDEVKHYLESNPAARRLFTVSGDTSHTAGADAMGSLGDRYWQLADKLAGSNLKAAKETARKSHDPAMEFWAAVHDNLPEKRYAVDPKTGKRKVRIDDRRAQVGIDPASLDVGQAFELNGHKFQVTENEDGLRLLKDGDDYPETPVEAFAPGEKIPVDKGTITEAKEPTLPEAPPDDVAPFAVRRRDGKMPGVNQEPGAGRTEPPADETPERPGGGVARLLRQYEDHGTLTIDDLVNRVESLGDDRLRGAVEAYRREQADDRALSGRGDMDQAATEFLNAIRPFAKPGAAATVAAPDSGGGFARAVEALKARRARGEITVAELGAAVADLGADGKPATKPEPIRDLFGREVLTPATGNRQGGLFHEPVDVAPPPTAKLKASKSAVDPENTGRLFAVKRRAEGEPADDLNAQGFYSHLRRTLDERMPSRATPEQVRGIIAGGQVKQDEVRWSGVEDWLRQQPAGPVAKQAVMDFLRGNEVKVEEVTKGSDQSEFVVSDRMDNVQFRSADRAEARAYADEHGGRVDQRYTGPTKFHPYVLPGGENYRELLFTLPREPKSDWTPAERAEFDTLEQKNHAGAATFADLQRLNELRRKDNPDTSNQFRSPHWDEPNVLAHVRFNDRTDADGKRVLFVEEVQSDWHQAGREKGYRPDIPDGAFLLYGTDGKIVSATDTEEKAKAWAREHDGSWVERHSRVGHVDMEAAYRDRVPQAPFAKTWHEFALKRLLRYAAEHGYDRLAWTTGEQQAARYDLSKQISEVAYSGSNLKAFDLDGKEVISRTGVRPEDLPDLIGKEATQKLMDQPPQGTLRRLAGVDLKVGGEGMKGFYDRIIPEFLNRYGKKWAARVRETQIPMPGKAAGETEMPEGRPVAVYPKNHYFTIKLEGTDVTWGMFDTQEQAFKQLEKLRAAWDAGTDTVHSIDVTPTMKRAVMTEGQPMFAVRRRGDNESVDEPGHGYDLDPDQRATRRLLDRSRYKELRGLTVNDQAYVWDAFDATHDDFAAKVLGGGAFPDSSFYVHADRVEAPQELHDHPFIRKLQDWGFRLAPPDNRGWAASDTPFAVRRRPAPQQGQTFELTNEAVWDTVRRKVQDEFLPVRTLQRDLARQGGHVADASNVYRKQELFRGRAAHQIREVEDQFTKPIVRQMGQAHLSMDDVDEYLYALHAPERNAQIAKVNPQVPDGGSGMTNAEAAAVLAKAAAGGKRPALDAVADLVRLMNEQTLKLQEDAGLIEPAAAAAMRATYQHYVPLRTDMEAEGMPSNRPGQGFDVRGREGRRATGRRSRADSPLTFAVMAANEKIVRAEKNRVGQAMLKLVRDNPDPGLWTVDRQATQKTVNPSTGLVQNQTDPRFQFADHVLAVKEAGQTHLIEFKGDAGRRIAAAMKRLNYQDGGAVVQVLHKAMRGYAALQTNLNPDFVLPNLIRDVQAAAINLSAEQTKGMAGRMIKGVLPAARAVWDVTGDPRAKPGGAYHDALREYLKAGGKVDAYALGGFERTGRTLENLLKDQNPSPARRLLLAARKGGELIDRVNGSVETATRLSAYVEARRAGMNAERAASLAKNLTVNFGRKGELGPAFNALYLFANASVQGNVRMAQALRTPRGRRIAAGIFGAGLAYALAAPALFGKDEEGRDVYDTIPDQIKSTNLLVPTGGGKYLKLPLPYGFSAVFGAGRLAGEAASGRQGPGQAGANLVTTAADAFNPLGSEGSFLQTLSPTVLDPFVQAAENKDWTGRPIVPEQSPFGPPKPDSQLARRDTSPYAKAVAEWLNSVTGGDEVTSGTADVSPATLEHFVGWATGGTGRFLERSADLPKRLAAGEEIAPNVLPIANRFVGAPPRGTNAREFYDVLARADDALSDLKHYEATGQGEKADALRQAKGKEVRFGRWARHLRGELADLRHETTPEAEEQGRDKLSEFIKAFRADELPGEWGMKNELADLQEKPRRSRGEESRLKKLRSLERLARLARTPGQRRMVLARV